MKNFVKVLGLSAALLSSSAHAMTLDWSGGYRFEWTEVDNPVLGAPGGRKAYGLNSLYLSPKIIAADGVNVISRFDVLTNSVYPNSQLGEIWGLNTNGSATTPGAATVSNQGAGSLRVSQLYLSMNQEYGALIVGRAPFEFGLGMTYSAGKGAFDHWYDTRDMVAYKIVVGDWFLMPVISRKQSTGFGQGGTISTVGAQLQYESVESKSLIGIYQESIKGNKDVLGYTASQIAAYGGNGVGTDLNLQRTNFVLGRGFDSFGFKLEAGFQSGETGVSTSTENVKLNGHGIAAEIYIPRAESKWDWKVQFGMATGDDSGSTEFGAYSFNRNYNTGMLMFNHRLGRADFLNTNAIKDTTALSISDSADDETISNAIYLAPSVGYAWSDRFEIRNTLIYGQLLNTMQNAVDSSKNLGVEWDIEVIYKPTDRVQWINQLGLLSPGDAFKNGTSGFENNFTFGFASKAAISF